MDDVTQMAEIEKAAKLLVERFGQTAVAEVEMRIAELKDAGEIEAVVRWRATAERVRDLVKPIRAC